MYKIEVNSIINQVIGLFYRLGFWIEEDESTVRKLKRKFFYLINFCIFVFSLTAGAATSDDKDEIVFLIAETIITIVLTGKLIYILWNKEEILAFIGEICVHFMEEREEFLRVNNKLKSFTRCVYCLPLLIIFGFIFDFVWPVISSGHNLPVNIWFPFKNKSYELVYWLAYAYVFFELLFAAVCILLNIIVWYIMVNCAIKFELLGSQLKKLGESKKTTAIKKQKISETDKQNLYHQDLISAIKSHQKLKNTTDAFQSCFSNLFFLQIATGGLCICGCVYTLVFTSSDNLVQYGLYLIILAYSTFDIFVITYLGNEIELKSDRLSYCLFESNWIDQAMPTKKCIIILTEVLKQRQQLVIWKLYPLNLEMFMRILNLAYSMFNILKNLT